MNDNNAADVLEAQIEKGQPPDTIGTEYDNRGRIKITFRWKCGTCIYLKYDFKTYLITLARFMDFWGTCLPGDDLNIKEKGGK